MPRQIAPATTVYFNVGDAVRDGKLITYVGKTNDYERRLVEHNRPCVPGSKTKVGWARRNGRDWRCGFRIEGFPTRKGAKGAGAFEMKYKSERKLRKWNIDERNPLMRMVLGAVHVLFLRRWQGPLRVVWGVPPPLAARDMEWPEYVKHEGEGLGMFKRVRDTRTLLSKWLGVK